MDIHQLIFKNHTAFNMTINRFPKIQKTLTYLSIRIISEGIPKYIY